MEHITIQSILNDLKKLVENPDESISPEQWIDAALRLQILKFDAQTERLAKEIIANKRKKELRATVESATDAEIEWKTTKEYEEYQKQDILVKEIDKFIQIAKKEADIRKL